MAALITDGLRAQYLEREGYEAQILEFIDMEHTPKNILIRAVKKRHAKEDNNIEASIKRCEAPGITDTGTSVGRVRHGVRKFRERSSGERG